MKKEHLKESREAHIDSCGFAKAEVEIEKIKMSMESRVGQVKEEMMHIYASFLL